MRILHLVGNKKLPADPDREGSSGVVRAVLEIAKAQVALGHRVTVAAVSSRNSSSEWQGVRLLNLAPARWLRPMSGRSTFHIHLPYMMLTAARKFDVVHAHLYSYTRFLRSRLRVVHFHSDPLNGDLDSRGLERILVDSDGQIAVSSFVERRLRTATGGRAQVITVHNGVDLTRFSAEDQSALGTQERTRLGIAPVETIFLYAGAIAPEKGLIHLARAFRALADCDESVHLVIAGSTNLWGGSGDDGHSRSAYAEEVFGELSAVSSNRVHYLGTVGPDSLPAVYAASDAVVVPSVWQEAFPLVALEALASGRPVIASAVGGLPEVIDGTNGQLVPPGDEDALLQALKAITARSAESTPQEAQSIRGSVANLTWPNAAERISGVYERLLAV